MTGKIVQTFADMQIHMTAPYKWLKPGSSKGFTLIEVLVGLIIGTLVVGGVMGVISVSLQFAHRVDKKSLAQPILEAAAQEILLHPELAGEGSLTLDRLPDSPTVRIYTAEELGSDGYNISSNRAGQLYRVQIEYQGNILEFSLLVPESKSE